MSNRLLVMAPNWLGDAVMALPALADLRRHYASAHLAVAARPSVAPLFTMVEGVDEVMTLPGGGGWRAFRGWRRDAEQLAARGFDTAILFPNSFAAAWIARAAGIPERWGYATDMRGSMLTRPVLPSRSADETHQHAYYQRLTRLLDVDTGPAFACVRPDTQHARQVLREIGLDVDEPFVVFAPGAAYGRAKQWLPARFAELATLLINERGWTVLMVGAAIDRDVCEHIASLMPRTGTRINRLIDFSGRTDLPTLAGVLSQARAVVSNDSGAMHLAAAVGAQVIALFGPTDERRTAPLAAGPGAPVPVVVTHEVFCRPCMLRECPIDHRCMRKISAHDVLRQLGS